jgi:putative aldouronate transport system permease protein
MLKGKTTPFHIINTVLMLLLMATTLYPFLYIIFASVSDPWQFVSHRGPLFAPLGFSIAAYKAVLTNRMMLYGFLNTAFNLIFGTSLNIFLTLIAAFAITRRQFLFRKPVTIMIIFTMLFTSGIIPRFLVIQMLGLYNTRLAMILPIAINVFNLMILRTAILGLPDSLEEAATIEGANEYQVLFKIVAPLVTSTIAVLVLYYGVSHWNQWFQALMYIQSRDKYPLQLVMREILINNATETFGSGSDHGESQIIGEIVKYAAIIVSTLPILAIYPILQRHFVKGVMIGALKG